jgi:hypothetical protein
MVSSSCPTSGTCHVNLFTNPVISHEWGKDREVFLREWISHNIISSKWKSGMRNLFRTKHVNGSIMKRKITVMVSNCMFIKDLWEWSQYNVMLEINNNMFVSLFSLDNRYSKRKLTNHRQKDKCYDEWWLIYLNFSTNHLYSYL